MRADDERECVEYLGANLARLHRTAYLLCGDAHLADDIVQSTAVALYLHWPRVRAADNIDGYVHRVLVRKHLDTKRLAWSRVVVLTAHTPDPPTAAKVGESTVEDRDAMAAALARLPVGQRTVLVLRYYADLTVEDTAAVLGCSVGNVKSQASRGLAALRNLVGQRDDSSATTVRAMERAR
jgi:RNA polymerase sigma-70 factor (sigma-E family)